MNINKTSLIGPKWGGITCFDFSGYTTVTPWKTRRMRKMRRRCCQRQGARTFEDTVGVRGDISRDEGWRWVFILPLVVLTRVIQYKIFLLESRHLKKVKGERKRVKW